MSSAIDDFDGEFVDEDDASFEPSQAQTFSQAVLYSSDWTVETILSQMERKNIDMNPRFQRRDAWNLKAKSRFIESVILGLPIPQIVLAEKRGQRGQFIVLDGKQRLLSLLQYAGKSDSPRNAFSLSGLEVRTDLARMKYSKLQRDPEHQSDVNAFLNHTIRAVVIRNWPATSFLHLVFLRLNTGSVKLSPQELRQAMIPGDYTDFADDATVASVAVKEILSRSTPDPRMRDVELFSRYVAFRRFMPSYRGRMKDFLDDSGQRLNESWEAVAASVRDDAVQFEAAIEALISIFGVERIARKVGSQSFNRAIFDSLIYYAAFPDIRAAMLERPDDVRAAYDVVLSNEQFLEAVESDTAGIPHTYSRFRIWGEGLQLALAGLQVALPQLDQLQDGTNRISFPGRA